MSTPPKPTPPKGPPAGYPSAFARLSHVLELRRSGKTYQQIADIVGVNSPQKAQKLVGTAIKRVLKETAEEVRAIELSRLDVLIECLWDKVIKDMESTEPDYRKFDRLKGLIETKLRWCGAQQVVDNSDKSITIVVQSFTKNESTPAPALPPAIPSLQQIEEMTETSTVGE